MTLARDEDRTPPPTSAVKPPVQFVTFEAMLPAAMALRAEAGLGYAVDVEFAIADRTIWLVQARPITALARSG